MDEGGHCVGQVWYRLTFLPLPGPASTVATEELWQVTPKACDAAGLSRAPSGYPGLCGWFPGGAEHGWPLVTSHSERPAARALPPPATVQQIQPHREGKGKSWDGNGAGLLAASGSGRPRTRNSPRHLRSEGLAGQRLLPEAQPQRLREPGHSGPAWAGAESAEL